MHPFTHPAGWGPVGGHTLTQIAGSMGPTLPSGQVVAIGRCGAVVGKSVDGLSHGKMGGRHSLGLSYGFAQILPPFPLPTILEEVENRVSETSECRHEGNHQYGCLPLPFPFPFPLPYR